MSSDKDDQSVMDIKLVMDPCFDFMIKGAEREKKLSRSNANGRSSGLPYFKVKF